MKPAALYVTAQEGGEYIPFGTRQRTVHSIHFADGSEWDAINGWRKEPLRSVAEWHEAYKRVVALRQHNEQHD